MLSPLVLIHLGNHDNKDPCRRRNRFESTTSQISRHRPRDLGRSADREYAKGNETDVTRPPARCHALASVETEENAPLGKQFLTRRQRFRAGWPHHSPRHRSLRHADQLLRPAGRRFNLGTSDGRPGIYTALQQAQKPCAAAAASLRFSSIRRSAPTSRARSHALGSGLLYARVRPLLRDG